MFFIPTSVYLEIKSKIQEKFPLLARNKLPSLLCELLKVHPDKGYRRRKIGKEFFLVDALALRDDNLSFPDLDGIRIYNERTGECFALSIVPLTYINQKTDDRNTIHYKEVYKNYCKQRNDYRTELENEYKDNLSVNTPEKV